jgi:hypothetical protein
MFGTPLIAAPRPAPEATRSPEVDRPIVPALCVKGRKPQLFDCGPEHGHLSMRQAAAIAGVKWSTIRKRIHMGETGAALVAPSRTGHFADPGGRPSCESMMEIAMRLARAFPRHVPTSKEIQAVAPMSLSAADNWRRSIALAISRALPDED